MTRMLAACGSLLLALSAGCSRPAAPPAAAPATADDAGASPGAAAHATAAPAGAAAPAPEPADPAAPAISATPEDAASAPPVVVDPVTLAAVSGSQVIAIGKLSMLFSECSGAGGIHTIFDVLGAPGRSAALLAHGGGHGDYTQPGLTPQNGMMLAGGRVIGGERWFVLGLRVNRRGTTSIKGWCIDSMPATDLDVVASIPVPSRAAAQQLVQRIAAAGP